MNKNQKVLTNFIALEGLDGSGTTTQLSLLGGKFEDLHQPYFTTCEPTLSPPGKLIREILKADKKALPHTIAYLFAADRNEHVYDPDNGILARHEKNEIVVCDRYLFSSLAYQSLSTDFEVVLSLNDHFPLPAHVFFLDTPVPVCMDRISVRKKKEIFEYKEIQEQVRRAYEKTFHYFKDYPFKIHIIDGTLPKEKVFIKIWEIIATLPIFKK